MKPYRVVVVICLILLYVPLAGQDLASIGKESPFRVSGGVSLSQIAYAVRGIESRRDPYSYYASGSINFSLYGWSCPLSFSLSNQGVSYQQPFNQYSLHPTYKAFTGHAGYISMSYSPYTVSGHTFLGGAVDVAPADSKWKFSGLYGRFLKAVEPDTAEYGGTAAYERMGYGAKVSYGSGNDFVDIILFHAEDDVNSIRAIPDSIGLLPEENLVMSIGAGKSLGKNFVLRGELASSALSRDTRSVESNQSHPLANTGFLYTSRISSSYYQAFKASLNYQQEGYVLGVGYERVAPGYRTLGAYYFNNDLENITANGAVALLKGKMNVGINAGVQRDNLDKAKISTMRRVVTAVNVAYAPSSRVNLGVMYSNFQTYTNIRSQFVDINQATPYDNLDTLNFTQISQSATATAMFMLGHNEQKRQTLNFNLTYQNAADKQETQQQNAGTSFYNGNVAYAVNFVPQNMMVSGSFNATVSESPGSTSRTFGPTVSVGRSFFEKKLRTTLSSSYNNTYANGRRTNTIINGRLNGSMTVQKKHAINLGLVVVNRSSNVEGAAQAFTEFTGTLGYSYSFGM
ncbi:hypothetical protein [Dawidia soli]|uniref:Uncharacterized protein n=1 Tax=Dawidia soli TaxID=2782352 RepID=A0AAP2GJN8_9BACT|nr:hypothetical protein [Dawidia soli]MBT1688700.1 hypothetical protein [Dawidia soli]